MNLLGDFDCLLRRLAETLNSDLLGLGHSKPQTTENPQAPKDSSEESLMVYVQGVLLYGARVRYSMLKRPMYTVRPCLAGRATMEEAAAVASMAKLAGRSQADFLTHSSSVDGFG